MKPAGKERLLKKNTWKYKQDRGWVNIHMALHFLPMGSNPIIVKFAGQLHFGIWTFRNNATDAGKKKEEKKKKNSFFFF